MLMLPAVGKTVGTMLGLEVGLAVGRAVGEYEGGTEGKGVGTPCPYVGCTDGLLVGEVGLSEGDVLGTTLGQLLGQLDGSVRVGSVEKDIRNMYNAITIV